MIRILPQNVINKIAAGEVVERPASVVKELVENALDAGASSIKVSIRGNALGGIEVVDDGCGMGGQDASLCLEHHATSKITAVGDLNAIGSFGFRGEALSSIAAVSRVTLITRNAGSGTGLKLQAVAGEISSREPAASVVGTRIRVEDLFFNVPARRKFLKSVRTEEALVAETVRNMALTAPHVSFLFRKEGRDVLSLPAAEEKQRVEDIFKGKSLFFAEGREGGLALRAWLTLPEEARKGTGGLVLIVNRRVVADRAVAGAIAAGHEGLLDKGRYPMGALFLE
ncbi:MAG: DNA mismatch repair endonuclease MutL, partial [Pseudomonadota bacterium]